MTLKEGLAALLYYDEVGLENKPTFEHLEESLQKEYIVKASKIILILDKLNFTVVPIKTLEDLKKQEVKTLEILTMLIRGFVMKLNTTRPQLFPCEELAQVILAGPEK